MKLILGLSLIWMLLSAAAALQCLNCGYAQCSNTTLQNCTTQKHCVTAAFQGKTQRSIQSCAPDAICWSNGSFSFSLTTTTIDASSTIDCCSTDNCNSGNVSVPGAQAANSLQCFSCDFNATNCSKTIQCRGAENNCFRATATATVGGVALPVRGCVSSNLCTAASNLSSLAASFNLSGLGTASNLSSLAAASNLSSLAAASNLSSLAAASNLSSLAASFNLSSLAASFNLSSLAASFNLSGLGTASPLSILGSFPGLSSISCCQGSLCNSAPAVATTTHLLLALLVFSLYR